MTASFCAICTSERGPFVQAPLGRNGSLVSICSGCNDEPAREGHGIERGFEPSGGLPTADGARAGAKRVMGAERWQRETDAILAMQRSPTPKNTAAQNDLAAYDAETKRLIERDREDWAPRGRRGR